MEPPARLDADRATAPDRVRSFEERGFVGPVRVFEAERSEAVARLLEAEPDAAEWSKGYAASSRALYSIGALPAIVDVVEALIGPDVVLWGASLVHRLPGQTHVWHVDIETSADEPGTVSVWIGLRNTDRRSSLQVLTRSHRWGVTPQELAHRKGKTRKEVDRDDAVRWAREIDPESELVELDMGDGDAVFFDGRLWHGTDNTRPEGVRTALLLQYAAAHRPIRIPDFSRLDYPFRFEEDRLPPCVVVRGEASEDVNRIVPPPAERSWVAPLELPIEMDEDTGMGRAYLHAGPTARVERLTCHASSLAPGGTPHEPHGHDEEEILVVLDGEAELVLAGEDGSRRAEAVGPGTVAYYPAGRRHTIRNPSDRPVAYLMFKWRNGTPKGDPVGALETRVVRTDADDEPEPGRWVGHPLFEGRTRHLDWLHAHRTTMAPGAGYEPHVDEYDVATVVLRGEVETLGRRLAPHDVAFCAAGEPHGLRNPGEEPAVYLVVEFHGDRRVAWAWRLRRWFRSAVVARVPRPIKSFVKRVLAALPSF